MNRGLSRLRSRLLAAAFFAAAVTALPAGSQPSLFTLRTSALNPDPGTAIELEVVSSAFDRAAASYQWSVNGIPDSGRSGTGRYQVTIPAGGDGETKKIAVAVATTTGGRTQQASVTVQAVSAPLYWWADTAVPYWYKGKALPTLHTTVTATALPNIPNAAGLNYRWEFNGALIPSNSGIGKMSASFTLDFPVEERIRVTMEQLQGSFKKAAATTAKPLAPAVAIYELRPLRGIVFERALSTFRALDGESYDFTAHSFYLGTKPQALSYRWTLNNREIEGVSGKPWIVSFTPSIAASSTNQLAVEVTDPGTPLGRATAAIRIDR